MASSGLARLLLPHPDLGSCIFAGVERDTRGTTLSDSERFNYYPATPMALVSWIFEGELHMVEGQGPASRAILGPSLPRVVISGPQSVPSASWSPGPVYALSVAFYPEALGRLCGTGIEPLLDQILPLKEVAGGAFLEACNALFEANDGADRFHCLENRLRPLWHAPSSGAAARMGDWVRSLATRAAFSTAGTGMRQIQRRIKGWTGQSHRDLQLFARVEEVMARSGEHRRANALDLAGLASDAGFADQSHMGREVRRVTGQSPARLDHLIAQSEAFWFYRLIQGHYDGM
ncbi:MAG TPA: helix-turn-helix domain-containing protein [Noviherbaspirillum sp.]|uniref:helix-turn-helix domain-containing protein n=1 Tax=Noviherbaspirillum sp. TaxID=1926288 RepID=UPI002D359236|nr:helix-turn-helix domain-containing protein [Noviherbaspirillum sp.]HYD93779.1 helix-turn-helix domain-containing protein [Noviherbaspirillum sp.]